MTLNGKFLLPPAIAALLLFGLAAVADYSLKEQRVALETVHANGSVAATLQRVRARAAEASLAAYRILNSNEPLDAQRWASERLASTVRFAEIRSLVLELDGEGGERGRQVGLDLSDRISGVGRRVDEALALGAIDPARGTAALGALGAEFAQMQRIAQETDTRLRGESSVEFGDALAIARSAQWVVWSVAGIAIAATLAIGAALAGSVVRPVRRASAFAGSIARGDLGEAFDVRSSGEIGQLEQALAGMQVSLRDLVGDVRRCAEGIAVASSQVAMGNGDLSGRTEQQASSLEQTASSIEHLTQTVRSNASSAMQANALAQSASEVAHRGGEVVGEVIERMRTISESSHRIAEIIGVIDTIAFQTNILALNAAVEAARAGEQGRGFAVVAGEVRSLAQRSAQAAREIKELISESVSQVESGSKRVRDAGATMAEIVGSVSRVTDIIGEISAATGEQSVQIGQVNTAVGQLEQMTQQNAALVEQSAAAAESMNAQALALNDAVSVFRLGDAGQWGESAEAKPPVR